MELYDKANQSSKQLTCLYMLRTIEQNLFSIQLQLFHNIKEMALQNNIFVGMFYQLVLVKRKF